jgi:flagellar basal-body rod modification protein FlgD
MSAIAETSSILSAANQAGSSSPPTNQASEDRFLTLLVAQMKNQDPLNPLDNAQVTTQMAQISTVSGIDRLNATLKALAAGFGEAQSLQAAALIGRDVLVAGGTLELGAGGAAGGFELAEAADDVVITISDGAGSVVHRASLGAQGAGVHSMQWDGATDAGGAAAAGRYRFSVAATRSGAAVTATALGAARVLGVARDADGTQLELSGLGRRAYAEVKQIL